MCSKEMCFKPCKNQNFSSDVLMEIASITPAFTKSTSGKACQFIFIIAVPKTITNVHTHEHIPILSNKFTTTSAAMIKKHG